MRSLTKDYMTRDHLLFFNVEVNVICKMMTKQKLKIGILQRPFAVIAKKVALFEVGSFPEFMM